MSESGGATPNDAEALLAELDAEFGRLIGQEAWSVLAGPGTGSVFTIDFGARIPRRRAVRNPTLTEDELLYRGEWSLLLECAWRLETPREVICTWGDSNARDGPIVSGLAQLRGRRLTGVRLYGPALDRSLRFDRRFALHVFCDRSPNYGLLTPRWSYGAHGHGRLVRHPHDPDRWG